MTALQGELRKPECKDANLIQGKILVGASASGLGSGNGEAGLLPFIEQV